MPSTKKLKKAGKKSKISAKPELARVGQRFKLLHQTAPNTNWIDIAWIWIKKKLGYNTILLRPKVIRKSYLWAKIQPFKK
jgi:hypothetical protein